MVVRYRTARSDERPLHVRVAEALGWTRTHHRDYQWDEHVCGDIMIADPERMRWKGRAPGEMAIGADCRLIPRYDTDWSATGPLIERYHLSVEFTAYTAARAPVYEGVPWWQANRHSEIYRMGETPLIAACNLILELHRAGKLPT